MLPIFILVAASSFVLVALAAICRHGYRAAAGHFDHHAELLRLPVRHDEPERRAA
jgi:hypothetical protein